VAYHTHSQKQIRLCYAQQSENDHPEGFVRSDVAWRRGQDVRDGHEHPAENRLRKRHGIVKRHKRKVDGRGLSQP